MAIVVAKAKTTTTTTTTTTTSARDDVNEQSPAHDPDILPHMYAQHDLEELFMKAEVPEDGDSAPQSRCMCSHPDCEVCFPEPGSSSSSTGPGLSEAWLAQQLPRRLQQQQPPASEQRRPPPAPAQLSPGGRLYPRMGMM